MSAEEVIESTLEAAGPGVAMFSKSYCPFCKRAKVALLGSGVVPVVVELDERSDGPSIQLTLMQKTKQRTVPSAWLDRKHIGGSDEVIAGVQSGLFKDVPKQKVDDVAEKAGLKKCGANDGIPCRCYDIYGWPY
mmetsp:Transcript_4167/g.8946  ORF Transcript_4167/g.8946 Transcript_4167/m.8946 type:complete len:134 (-) Transcript_4167:1826-2227(-)